MNHEAVILVQIHVFVVAVS